MTAFRATVLTLFPDMFPGPLGHSLPGKALAEGRWALATVNIRDFATDNHQSVDDAPYGGGAGMVMRPDIMQAAIAGAEAGHGASARRLYLSPRGRLMDQALMKDLVAAGSVMLICGRYEGLDERLLEAEKIEEVSLGDFVLAGGEIAALALLEACARLLPGVLGNDRATVEESFEDGLLEYPHYTRPAEWRGMAVPPVLLSGHHDKIRAWRRGEAERITQARRPDLWARYQRRQGIQEHNEQRITQEKAS